MISLGICSQLMDNHGRQVTAVSLGVGVGIGIGVEKGECNDPGSITPVKKVLKFSQKSGLLKFPQDLLDTGTIVFKSYTPLFSQGKHGVGTVFEDFLFHLYVAFLFQFAHVG